MSRCPISDLPRSMCAHCLRVPDQATIGPPVAAPRFNPDQLRLRLDYRSGRWHTPTEHKPIACDHGRPDGSVLCPLCEEALFRAIADVPRLVADLDIHFSKQNVFLERGVPQHPDDDDDVPDESPVPFVEAASSVLSELRRAVGDNPARAATRLLERWRDTLRRPDLAYFANRLSRTVYKGFRVIDMDPYLTHYGICPTCKGDIRQEKVNEGERVHCGCGYSAEVGEHRRAQLDLAADTPMTLTRVVQVLNDAGEHTTRQEVENLIYRDGLPREKLPVWAGGRLETTWHYRLGDVREWRRKKRRPA